MGLGTLFSRSILPALQRVFLSKIIVRHMNLKWIEYGLSLENMKLT